LKFIETKFRSVFVVEQNISHDNRGTFVKTFQKSLFNEHQLQTGFVECFHTKSEKNVIRGMHFQSPPQDHAKLISVIAGTILDVILDIRIDSPTYKQFITLELSEENHQSVYIPSGFAHGFCSLSDEVTVSYMTTSEHSPEHDKGIRYDSIGFDWPIKLPILSIRDLSSPLFNEFESPFNGETGL